MFVGLIRKQVSMRIALARTLTRCKLVLNRKLVSMRIALARTLTRCKLVLNNYLDP